MRSRPAEQPADVIEPDCDGEFSVVFQRKLISVSRSSTCQAQISEARPKSARARKTTLSASLDQVYRGVASSPRHPRRCHGAVDDGTQKPQASSAASSLSALSVLCAEKSSAN